MIAIAGTYRDGQVILDKPMVTENPVKVIVTFLEEIVPQTPTPNGKRLTFDDFSFAKSRELFKNHTASSFIDALIEERRGDGL